MFALPVVAGKATVAALTAAGGQAVVDHPDMCNVNGSNFRRTASYLMWYPGALDILTALKDDPFAQDYNRPGRLALVSLDLAAFRIAAPTQYKASLERMKDRRPTANSTEIEAVKSFVNNLNYYSLAIARDPQNLHIETWMRPFDFKGSRKFPKPSFPADIVAQMHIVYPNAESVGWFNHFIAEMPNESFKRDKQEKQLTAEQAARVKALMIRAVKLLTGADAQSLGLGFKAGKPILYAVNQYTNDLDFAGEMQSILANGDKLDKETGDTDSPIVSKYQSAGGKSVTRVLLMNKDKKEAYIDFVQTGHVVDLTIAADDGKYLDTVAGLPTNGEISNLCVGSVDLTAALKAEQESGETPKLHPDQLHELTTAFNGQSITWVAKTIEQTKDVYIDLAIPFGVLKELPKMMMGAQPRPAPEPAPEGTTPGVQN